MRGKRILLIITLVAAGITGIWLYNNFIKTSPSMHRQKAELSVSAVKLYNDFDADEQNANQMYLNKVIEVSGTIDSIQEGSENKPVVLLSTEGFGLIKASLESAEELQSISEGQGQILLRGECIGLLLDVLMINCIVVKE